MSLSQHALDDEDEEACIIAAMAAALAATSEDDTSKRPINYPAKRRGLEMSFDPDEWLDRHTDKEIQGFFRMDRASFEELHTRLALYLQTKHPHMGVRSNGHALSSKQRLMAALRFFGGGAVMDIAEMFQMARPRVREAVRMTISAVNLEFEHEWTFPWLPPHCKDSDPQAWAEMMDRLRELELDHAELTTFGRIWRGQVRVPIPSAFNSMSTRLTRFHNTVHACCVRHRTLLMSCIRHRTLLMSCVLILV